MYGVTFSNTGVPQGFVLGPLTFAIYTAWFISQLNFCQNHTYTDDTHLCMSFVSGNWQTALYNITADLESLGKISAEFDLHLNPSKSKVLSFGKSKICKKKLAKIVFQL